MFPKINAEVKSALRWYRKPELRNRNLQRCSGEGSCPYAVPMPNNLVMPFQLVAGTGEQFGHSTPTSWKVYALDGTLEQDLSAHISSLQVLQFSNPNRDYIMLESELFLSTALSGQYLEMEIVTAGGTYYSETFSPMCAETISLASDPVEWSYSEFPGLVDGILTSVAGLPSDPATGSKYLVIETNGIHTWDGSSYNLSSPVDNRYYSTSVVGSTWYLYTTDDGVQVAPDQPITLDPMPCWSGVQNEEVAEAGGFGVIYGPIELSGDSQAVSIHVEITGITGEFTFTVGGAAQSNITGSTTVSVTLEEGDTIEIAPVEGAVGCISVFTITSDTGSGANCYHKLSWRSCGDIGTHRYKFNDYRNNFYFPVNDKTFLGEPSPKFSLENEDGAEGEDVPIFTRKDTDWRIDLAEVPWWLLDALTEIPLHDDVQLTLQGETEPDQIQDVKINYDWNDPCLARVDIEFRVDDPTVAAGCCESFDPICLAACAEVDGIEGVDTLVVNKYYARSASKKFGQYLGLDAEAPVDAQGFAYNATCTTGFLQFTDATRPYVYWTGSAWAAFVVITQVLGEDCEAGEIRVKATIAMPEYTGQVQYTLDGTTWLDTEGVFSASEFAAGVFVTIPTDTQSIRVMALGTDCNVGFSAKAGSPCYVCAGEGTFSMTLTDTISAVITTTTSDYYATYRASDGTLTQVLSSDTFDAAAGSWCAWSSDGVGNQADSIESIEIYGSGDHVEDFVFDRLANLTSLVIYLLGGTLGSTLNLDPLTGLTTLAIDGCANAEGIGFSTLVNLQYVNLTQSDFVHPDLTASTGLINFGANGCTSLTGANLPSSVHSIDFSNCTSLITSDISGVTALVWINYSGATNLTTIDGHGLLNLGNGAFTISSCPALNSVDLSGCALSQSVLTSILISLDTQGRTDIVADFSGGTTPHPTSYGLTAYNNLIAKGCTITVNP